MRRPASPFAMILSAVLALTGCGFTATGTQLTPAVMPAFSGVVHGGQSPINASVVTIWAMGSGSYGSSATQLGSSTTTDAGGGFSFAAGFCPDADTPIYITAQGGQPIAGSTDTNANIALAAGLGACGGVHSVQINEITTVATAFALAQFFTKTLGTTDDFGGPPTSNPYDGLYAPGLVMANSYTIPTLVNLTTGNVNPSTSATTIESAKIISLANSLAGCVNTTGTSIACSSLFANTTPPGGSAPTDTLQAAVQIALYPYQNVFPILLLAGSVPPFGGGLTATPNDWTIGVSYNAASASNLGLSISGTDTTLGTTSNIDIDASGHVWFPTNVSGHAGVGSFDPTTNSFAGPFGDPSVTQPQYVSIDQGGTVWATDLVSANIIGVNTANPSGTVLTATLPAPDIANPPATLPCTNGHGGPIATDYDSTLFIAIACDGNPYLDSYDPTRTTLSGDLEFIQTPTGLLSYEAAAGSGEQLVFAVTNAPSSDCYQEQVGSFAGTWYSGLYTLDGGASPCASGGIASAALESEPISVETTFNELCAPYDNCFAPAVGLAQPEGIATDGGGNEWVANAGNASVSTLYGYDLSGSGNDFPESSTVPYLHDSSNGNTMFVPYGIAIDASGNVWTSNAGCVTTSTTPCTPASFVLSELIGAANATITPLSAQNGGTLAGTQPMLKHTVTVPHRRIVQDFKPVATARQGLTLP